MTVRRSLKDIDAVKREVARIVDKQKADSTGDVQRVRAEIDALLGSFSVFLPQWSELPSVFRLARVETSARAVPYSENTVLPNIKHELETLVEMFNYMREQKDLPPVKMPLFLQPDDISLALERPGECHCDEEQTIASRQRSAARLGRRGTKKWVWTRQKILNRDDRTCQRCGAQKDLHVHRLADGRRDNDLASYVTLCRRCHVVEGRGLSPEATALRFRLDQEGALDGTAIRSQLALVFQYGKLEWVGVVVGREYFVLKS